MPMLQHAEVEEVCRRQPLLSVDALHAAAVAATHEEAGEQQSAAEYARERERLQQGWGWGRGRGRGRVGVRVVRVGVRMVRVSDANWRGRVGVRVARVVEG